MISATGCTPAQVWSEWDIPALIAQTRYWTKHPPTHLLIEAYVGFKPSEQAQGPVSNAAAIEAIMSSFPEAPPRVRAVLAKSKPEAADG